MCTLTWFTTDNGFELFFNRDEQKTRGRAIPPAIAQTDGIQYLAPTDVDASGTWIAVNEYGVAVCLLNHYRFQQIESYQDWTSRGNVVRMFAGMHDLALASAEFRRMPLGDYRAFRMFMILPDGQNRLFVWDGHEPKIERNITTPKSSSAIQAQHVKAVRKKYFADLGIAESPTREAFIKYHRSHFPEKSEISVCMHRDEACTVSLSHLVVTAGEAEFYYADGAPCEAELKLSAKLPLRDPLAHSHSLSVSHRS